MLQLQDLGKRVTKIAIRGTAYMLYRGVLVVFDEDRDDRILAWLDTLPAGVIDRIFAVMESKGVLGIQWCSKPFLVEEAEVWLDYWPVDVNYDANGNEYHGPFAPIDSLARNNEPPPESEA